MLYVRVGRSGTCRFLGLHMNRAFSSDVSRPADLESF
jgi:hypothetical protein